MASMAEEYEELRLPPCKVCGGKASGRHFGVIACEACKSFFKRNRNREKPYRCRGEKKGACIVKAGLGYPICPFCRHQASIRAGMSRDGIHKGRCPIEVKADLLLQAKEYQAKARAQQNSKLKECNDGGSKSPENIQNATTSTILDLNEIQANDDNEIARPISPTQLQSASNFSNSDLSETTFWKDLEENQHYQQENMFVPSAHGEFMTMLTDNSMPIPFETEESLYHPTMPTVSIVRDIQEPTCGLDVDEIIMETFIRSLIEADAQAPLYDAEELVDVKTRINNYILTKKANQDLVGDLPPLPHDVYTEIYKSTGLDIDDYRKKIFQCVQDLKPDIDVFLDYVRLLPSFKDFSLHDRTLIAKGGFAGWMVLSSISAYSSELDVWACTSEVIHSTNDFIAYFNKQYSEHIRKCLTILQNLNVTTEELAILKAMHIFKERHQVGHMENTACLAKLQEDMYLALQLVLERGRGRKQTKIIMPELQKIFPHLDGMTIAYKEGVRNWPVKFPEYTYPRILLEMVGHEADEELLVAVSVKLNMNG